MNKVIRMTEEIWNLPAGAYKMHRGGHYCAMGKIGLALGIEVPDYLTSKDDEYALQARKIPRNLGVCAAIARNDSGSSWNLTQSIAIADKTNHEIAIRMGIEALLADGFTLETDDTVSKELARIKSCAEVV